MGIWKKEWTVIAIVAASLVLLVMLGIFVAHCVVNARRRRAQKRIKRLGYNPKMVSGTAASYAWGCFLCGILMAVEFLDRD